MSARDPWARCSIGSRTCGGIRPPRTLPNSASGCLGAKPNSFYPDALVPIEAISRLVDRSGRPPGELHRLDAVITDPTAFILARPAALVNSGTIVQRAMDPA